MGVYLQIISSSHTLRLDSDYDSNLPVYDYIVEVYRSEHRIPFWHPYIEPGISLLGDPLSAVFHPMTLVPFLLLGVDSGMKMLFLVSVFLSGISMYILGRKIGLFGWPLAWITYMYQCAGGLAARFAAGHIEKVISYPVIPLFLSCSLSRIMTVKDRVGIAVISIWLLYSGDIYSLWFCLLAYLCIRLYWIACRVSVSSEIRNLTIIIWVFGIGALPRVYAFITHVLPNFARFHAIDPGAGSLHPWFQWIPYVLPFGVELYDRPIFQRLFGFWYNWYEYFSFISPIPLLFIVYGRRKATYSVVLLFLLGVASQYISMNYAYSTFHWLTLFGEYPFRVPQRMLFVMTPVLLALAAYGLTMWLEQSKQRRSVVALSLISVCWSLGISILMVRYGYETPRTNEQQAVEYLTAINTTQKAVYVTACCMQRSLVRAHMPIVNYYYGWKSNQYSDTLESGKQMYIIASETDSISESEYKKIYQNATIHIWERL